MKILEFHIRNMKIIEILKLDATRIMQINKKDSISCENYEHHENHRITYENHETHENHGIPYENHENQENIRIPSDNHENNENH